MVEAAAGSSVLGKRTHKEAQDQPRNGLRDEDTTHVNGPSNTDPNEVEYNAAGQRVTQKTLRGFVSTKDGKPLIFSSKSGKHAKSLWRDEQLYPTKLEQG